MNDQPKEDIEGKLENRKSTQPNPAFHVVLHTLQGQGLTSRSLCPILVLLFPVLFKHFGVKDDPSLMDKVGREILRMAKLLSLEKHCLKKRY